MRKKSKVRYTKLGDYLLDLSTIKDLVLEKNVLKFYFDFSEEPFEAPYIDKKHAKNAHDFYQKLWKEYINQQKEVANV